MIENTIRPFGFAIPNETGNSKLRQLAAKTTEKVVIRLHEAFPWLTADHLTYIGTAGIVVGALLARERQSQKLHHKKQTISAPGVLIELAGSSAFDLLDGSMARLQKADTKRGQIVDVVNDRVQEGLLGLVRADMARTRKDKLGEVAALLNTVTNPLSSLARAKKEAEGIGVKESGKGIGILGTRVGRTVLNTIALVFPEIHQVPVQTILDLVGTTSNLITVAERLNAKPGEPLSIEVRQKAISRQKAIGIVTGLIAGASLVYLSASKK